MAFPPNSETNKSDINKNSRRLNKLKTNLSELGDEIDNVEKMMAINEVIDKIKSVAKKYDVSTAEVLDYFSETGEEVEAEINAEKSFEYIKDNLVSVFDHGSNEFELIGFKVEDVVAEPFKTCFFISFTLNGKEYEIDDEIVVGPKSAGHDYQFHEKVGEKFAEKLASAVTIEIVEEIQKYEFKEQLEKIFSQS